MPQGKLDEKCEGYQHGEDDLVVYKGRFCILNCAYLKKVVMNEIHQMPYFGHPGYEKKITIRKQYFGHGMKKDIT